MKNGMAAVLVAGLVGWTSVAWADDPLPRAKPEDVGLSSERLARIATFAKAEIDAGQIPGAVIVVARRGKLVYFEAFGQSDKKAGTAMRDRHDLQHRLDDQADDDGCRAAALRAGPPDGRRAGGQVSSEVRRDAGRRLGRPVEGRPRHARQLRGRSRSRT